MSVVTKDTTRHSSLSFSLPLSLDLIDFLAVSKNGIFFWRACVKFKDSWRMEGFFAAPLLSIHRQHNPRQIRTLKPRVLVSCTLNGPDEFDFGLPCPICTSVSQNIFFLKWLAFVTETGRTF